MKLSGPALYGLAADKASLFLDRYVVLHQVSYLNSASVIDTYLFLIAFFIFYVTIDFRSIEPMSISFGCNKS